MQSKKHVNVYFIVHVADQFCFHTTIVLHVLNGLPPPPPPLPSSLLPLPSFITHTIMNISRVLERIVAIVMIEAYVMSANRLLPTSQIAMCFVRHLILISPSNHFFSVMNETIELTIVSDDFTTCFSFCIAFSFRSLYDSLLLRFASNSNRYGSLEKSHRLVKIPLTANQIDVITTFNKNSTNLKL